MSGTAGCFLGQHELGNIGGCFPVWTGGTRRVPAVIVLYPHCALESKTRGQGDTATRRGPQCIVKADCRRDKLRDAYCVIRQGALPRRFKAPTRDASRMTVTSSSHRALTDYQSPCRPLTVSPRRSQGHDNGVDHNATCLQVITAAAAFTTVYTRYQTPPLNALKEICSSQYE